MTFHCLVDAAGRQGSICLDASNEETITVPRAHKVEPFLVQSVVIASATAALVLLLARSYGVLGASRHILSSWGSEASYQPH